MERKLFFQSKFFMHKNAKREKANLIWWDYCELKHPMEELSCMHPWRDSSMKMLLILLSLVDLKGKLSKQWKCFPESFAAVLIKVEKVSLIEFHTKSLIFFLSYWDRKRRSVKVVAEACRCQYSIRISQRTVKMFELKKCSLFMGSKKLINFVYIECCRL